MKHLSVWRAGFEAGRFPTLQEDIDTDVVIVGGGITGVTLAALLADSGPRVVLLEAFAIGEGTTGHSTGNLYGIVGPLHELHSAWGNEVARTVVQSRQEAVDLIELIARRLPVDCRFERVPQHLYAVDASAEEDLRREYELLHSLGVPCSWRSDLPVTQSVSPVLRIEGQAQFHPLAYVRALAQHVASDDCRFFEHSPALAIDHDSRMVRTAGGSVHAREVVLATHTPKGLFALHAEMTVHREYAVAGPIGERAPLDGINWGRGAGRHSVRRAQAAGRDWLVVIGAEVKTGRHDGRAELRTVASRAEQQFGLVPELAWSAQNYHSPDHIPYIGRSIGSETFIATGFAADGLTYGALAARVIADAINGRGNPYEDLYSARRVTPVKSARGIVEENAVVLQSFAQDYVTRRATGSINQLQPDSGALVEHEGKRVAAYKAADGSVTMLSPACTHLKCIVHWNAAERSWDCPCHGSRFATDGQVLEGPAVAPLARITTGADAIASEPT